MYQSKGNHSYCDSYHIWWVMNFTFSLLLFPIIKLELEEIKIFLLYYLHYEIKLALGLKNENFM